MVISQQYGNVLSVQLLPSNGKEYNIPLNIKFSLVTAAIFWQHCVMH